jgi:hypothetical protein
MRRIAVTLLLAAFFMLVGPHPGNAAPYCGITWGSLPKGTDPITELSPGPITGARPGRHDCYDRYVIDVANNTEITGYRVEYVDQFRGIGSGDVIPLAGGGKLSITVFAPDHDGGGDSTTGWSVATPIHSTGYFSSRSFATFREAKYGGSFEGYTAVGLGVRARLPFRVLRLVDADPVRTRIVIDVAHKW